MKSVYICEGVRTPIGRYGGSLATVRTDDLAAHPLAALRARFEKSDWESIDEVVLGCVNQAGEDNRNVARMAALLAGIPWSVPAATVNRLCASGMEAVSVVAREIASGEISLGLAGGVESMSRAPLVIPKATSAFSRNAEIYDSTIGWRLTHGRSDATVVMPPFSVAVSDSVFPNLDPAREVLSRVGAELRLAADQTPEAIVEVARNADATLVTYTKITAEIIRQMKQCRIIARFGIGVDNVDLPAATAANIVVTKVPDYCIDEVSDHTLALLLALARKIPFSNSQVHSGIWKMGAVAPIHRLRGGVLGLVGFGRIPRLVAPKAQAFGLKVVTYDPHVSKEAAAAAGVEKVDFAQLVKDADYISIHTPLLPETDRLFSAKIFAQMKPTAYLINTARGPIVDEADLARALDAGQLAGAALDVLSHEPPSGSPLFGRTNVILTPHTSFYSVESLVELQIKAAEEVVRVLTGEAPRYPVNPEALQSGRETALVHRR